MDNQSLEAAVTRFKRGERQYFDVIYEATKTKVYYTILTILKDPSLSEDIMQDTYLKMIEQLPKYKKRNTFSAWLVTIARNMALNTYNRRKREMLVDQNEHVTLFGSTQSSQENNYYLSGLMTALNEAEKEVVIRHVILEEKHKDIAKAMDKPLGTITWMYQNALKKLREKAGDQDA